MKFGTKIVVGLNLNSGTLRIPETKHEPIVFEKIKLSLSAETSDFK